MLVSAEGNSQERAERFEFAQCVIGTSGGGEPRSGPPIRAVTILVPLGIGASILDRRQDPKVPQLVGPGVFGLYCFTTLVKLGVALGSAWVPRDEPGALLRSATRLRASANVVAGISAARTERDRRGGLRR